MWISRNERTPVFINYELNCSFYNSWTRPWLKFIPGAVNGHSKSKRCQRCRKMRGVTRRFQEVLRDTEHCVLRRQKLDLLQRSPSIQSNPADISYNSVHSSCALKKPALAFNFCWNLRTDQEHRGWREIIAYRESFIFRIVLKDRD